MKAHRAAHTIATLCRVLDVSPSGYYAWHRRTPSPRVQEEVSLATEIEAIHTHSRGTYGAPRIHAELVARGRQVSRKRVARLLRVAGLRGVSRRKFVVTTTRAADARPAPDLVRRAFTATRPNQLDRSARASLPRWSASCSTARRSRRRLRRARPCSTSSKGGTTRSGAIPRSRTRHPSASSSGIGLTRTAGPLWKLPGLWTPRRRPQVPWKTRSARFPQLPQGIVQVIQHTM